MMKRKEFVVNPNRFELGPDAPGRNGHFRTISPAPASISEPCSAQVRLPRKLSELADPDGTVTFGGYDWWFVVGAARAFAHAHIGSDVLPPFGFKDRGQWWWWDNTTTEESILEGPEGIDYVREYLGLLFPRLSITTTDNR